LPGLLLTPATILRVRGMPASFRRQARVGWTCVGRAWLIGTAGKPTRVLWTADAAGVVTR
jgi:hypothetical protein